MIIPKSRLLTPSWNRPSKILGTALIGCSVLLLCSQPAATDDKGQLPPKEKPYALIFGTVWGPDSRPIYGVHVKIRRANEKKVRWELYSDHNGEFAQRVPAGKAEYLVWADLRGFKLQKHKKLESPGEVHVQIEYDERADIGLHLK